jgi:hypothetical protein
MPQNQVIVGPQYATDGQLISARGGKEGAAVGTQLHGKHYEANVRGNIFIATTVIAGLGFPVAAATLPATGLIIHNPAGTRVNVELISFTVGASSSAFIVNGLGLMLQYRLTATSGAPTGLTSNYTSPLGPVNSTPAAQVYSAATCTNVAIPGVSAATAVPIPFYPMLNFPATGLTDVRDITHFFDGRVVLPPDSLAAPCASKAAETNLKFMQIIWAEWPV